MTLEIPTQPPFSLKNCMCCVNDMNHKKNDITKSMFPCIKICLINYLFHEKCKRKARDVQFRVIVFPNV